MTRQIGDPRQNGKVLPSSINNEAPHFLTGEEEEVDVLYMEQKEPTLEKAHIHQAEDLPGKRKCVQLQSM